MYNVQFYPVLSPQTGGTTRYGIAVANALVTTRRNPVYSGFVTLDTSGPFVLTKISTAFTQGLYSGTGAGTQPGFINPLGFEFRLWDETNGRQLFQSNISGIDDGFIPFNAFGSTWPIAASANQGLQIYSSPMSGRFYSLPEECEFPAGGVIRVDVRSCLATTNASIAAAATATVYMTLMGFTCD